MMSRIIFTLLLMVAVPSSTNNYSQFADRDGDGITDDVDNCADVANDDQADVDGDLIGDACDADNGDGDTGDGDGDTGDGNTIPELHIACPVDRDDDGIPDADDNCPDLANPDQADADEDNIGDVCEEDGSAPVEPGPIELING